ncbi:MAG: HAD family phosphatase, partial [Paramuribaculum sp.]|nr:HAD family phosphatase [Paramuribaculum sp.]
MIKNLLFDLGGVIMDIKRDDCVAAFEAIGMADADSYLGEYVQAGFFAGVENGSLTRRIPRRRASGH